MYIWILDGFWPQLVTAVSEAADTRVAEATAPARVVNNILAFGWVCRRRGSETPSGVVPRISLGGGRIALRLYTACLTRARTHAPRILSRPWRGRRSYRDQSSTLPNGLADRPFLGVLRCDVRREARVQFAPVQAAIGRIGGRDSKRCNQTAWSEAKAGNVTNVSYFWGNGFLHAPKQFVRRHRETLRHLSTGCWTQGSRQANAPERLRQAGSEVVNCAWLLNIGRLY